jgi:Trk-type K+ transport system membrane component
MNLVLFISVLVVSFIAVRIGAIVFQLTGLEWSLAKFQSLSCFTGTGFTTREAELITGNPQRRRIASVLMVLGNAGLVTLIATFANTLRPPAIRTKFSLPFLPAFIPSRFVPWINLLTIVIATYVVYRIFTNAKLVKRLTAALRSKVARRQIFKPVLFEELLPIAGGYGVLKIDVRVGSPLLGKTLSESELRGDGVTVLAITTRGESKTNPSPDTKLGSGDELICFGKITTIKERISTGPGSAVT